VGDEFDLTQEALAHMLGARRPGVSVATARLQRAGLIRYRRGRMLIGDRPGLEAVSCECYPIVHAEFERLLGW
jgi:Mn-dependent DtxR family transcriptional regulator